MSTEMVLPEEEVKRDLAEKESISEGSSSGVLPSDTTDASFSNPGPSDANGGERLFTDGGVV